MCSDADDYERTQPVEKISLFILYRINYTPLDPLDASKGCLSRQIYATAREHSGINNELLYTTLV